MWITRSTLFACVLAATAFGCRNDRPTDDMIRTAPSDPETGVTGVTGESEVVEPAVREIDRSARPGSMPSRSPSEPAGTGTYDPPATGEMGDEPTGVPTPTTGAQGTMGTEPSTEPSTGTDPTTGTTGTMSPDPSGTGATGTESMGAARDAGAAAPGTNEMPQR